MAHEYPPELRIAGLWKRAAEISIPVVFIFGFFQRNLKENSLNKSISAYSNSFRLRPSACREKDLVCGEIDDERIYRLF
jgi:hypothetical protein